MQQKNVAIVLFNTLTSKGKFWGNMELSLLSGKLELAGIKNEIFVIMMQPGKEETNKETIFEFVEIAQTKKIDTIIMHSPWLPWFPDLLRKKTGAKVYSLDGSEKSDIPDELSNLNIHDAIIAILKGATKRKDAIKVLRSFKPRDAFNPCFNYTFLGCKTPPKQEIAFVSIQSCPYKKDIRSNPYFKNLSFNKNVSLYGCSYCYGASNYKPIPVNKKRQILANQILILQRKLPSLKEIAIPFPEDYLEALEWVIDNHQTLGINKTTFSGQFRAGALVEAEEKIYSLIEKAQKNGFKFIIRVVGLESFCERDLMLYNRDSVETVKEAVKVLIRLRNNFNPPDFMSETVGSFILFHPWQTFEGLKLNVKEMIESGISGIFDTININDLRINPLVPLYTLAKKYSLTTEPQQNTIGEPPLGGYFAQYPWVYQNKDVEIVNKIYSKLQYQTNHRIGLLKSIIQNIEKNKNLSLDPVQIQKNIEELSNFIHRAGAEHAQNQKIILTGSFCNQKCNPCVFDNAIFPDPHRKKFLTERGNIKNSIITIAGREPAIHPAIIELIKEIQKSSPQKIQLLTNGRIFIYPEVALALLSSGISKFIIKLHSHEKNIHDRICRVNGALNQTIKGIRCLLKVIGENRRFRPVNISLALIIGAHNRKDLKKFVDFASSLNVNEIKLVLPVSNLEFDACNETKTQIELAIEYACKKHIKAAPDPLLSFHWSL